MARDRRLSLVSGAGGRRAGPDAESPASNRPTADGPLGSSLELASGDPLIATGDGMWVHDTHTDPAPESTTGRVKKAIVERNDRIFELESELADAKREIDELRSQGAPDLSDDLTLPRAVPPPRPSSPKTLPVDLIPRLPPRPAPPPKGYAPKGTLMMAPAVTELPLPPPKIARPLAPSEAPPLVLGAFDEVPTPPPRPAPAPRPKQPVWLFVALALSSFGLAATGYSFIAEVGPFARQGAKSERSAAPSVSPTSSSLPASADRGSSLPIASFSSSPNPAGVPSPVESPAVTSALSASASRGVLDEATLQPTTLPSSRVAPVEATALPAAPSVDVGALLSYQGYLTVHSARALDVVVQGIPAGRTNEPLLVRCGPKNVRLRDGTQWMTEGQHVHIDCMKLTEVTIDSTP